RAKVLDPEAAEVQGARERPRLGQQVEPRTGSPGRLCERRTSVRRAEHEHMTHEVSPRLIDPVVASTARHQPTHGVTDEGELRDFDRPRVHELVDEPREPTAVV